MQIKTLIATSQSKHAAEELAITSRNNVYGVTQRQRDSADGTVVQAQGEATTADDTLTHAIERNGGQIVQPNPPGIWSVGVKDGSAVPVFKPLASTEDEDEPLPTENPDQNPNPNPNPDPGQDQDPTSGQADAIA